MRAQLNWGNKKPMPITYWEEPYGGNPEKVYPHFLHELLEKAKPASRKGNIPSWKHFAKNLDSNRPIGKWDGPIIF